ncbi:MAG TPA: hypothetical protein DCE42_02880 [Myxococcales bacterium]|nr:hypothetical protein [Deltaproteobacteria bacterium]HAA53670.1 hypothetical protein [Myxococcales bacterium]|tara:strand:- start:989 stop:1714 length:726 start_codon:yes stop_codon:yes gene_type:complete
MTAKEQVDANVIAGVDRAHGRSYIQKFVFLSIHLVSLALCGWVVFGGALEMFGKGWAIKEPVRASIVFGVTALYVFRHGITLFYLLQRKVVWSEALSLSFFLLPMEVGFCVLATGVFRGEALSLWWLDYVALGFVLVGSFFNSWSELQRKWWKKDPAHKGKCYTGGLFAYSMHVNYFGDTLLFTGWALLTSVWWTLGLPLFMAISFIFFHIPGLDTYLEERYGDEFKEYASKTKKFVPFVY